MATGSSLCLGWPGRRSQGLIKDLDLVADVAENQRDTFGSRIRDRAMILETLTLLNDTRANQVFDELSKDLRAKNRWHTHQTAFALISVARWMAANAPGGKPLALSVRVGDENVFQGQSSDQVLRIAIPTPRPNASLSVTNQGPDVFLRLTARGLPPLGKEKPIAAGLSLDVKYETKDGKSVDLTELKQGTDIKDQSEGCVRQGPVGSSGPDPPVAFRVRNSP